MSLIAAITLAAPLLPEHSVSPLVPSQGTGNSAAHSSWVAWSCLEPQRPISPVSSSLAHASSQSIGLF